jgi:predicted aspartyl protease
MGQMGVESTKVPFRLTGGQNPLIVVPVQVDDTGPYPFILDTGASHCLLSRELSKRLQVQPEMEKQAMGAGGPITLAFAHVASMAVGCARQSNVPVAITSELERIGAAIGSRVEGGLGFSFLKDFSLTIDYSANSLSLAPPLEVADVSRSANAIPFKLAAAHKPLILLQVMVNGRGPFQFALDTGASRTMLSCELAETLAIEIVQDSPVTGGGGQIEVFAGTVGSLAVGNALVRDHAIGAGGFLALLSQVVDAKLDGILGYNFLNEFRVTIDYPRQIVELVPAGVG